MAETGKRRRGEGGDDGGVAEKATKWAKEFGELAEEDQYVYLEQLASAPMNKMHLNFLQGVLGDDDEEEEEDFGSGEEGEEDEDDEEEGGEEGGDDDDE